MATFLLEIGSEEIPSRFMAAYEHDLATHFETAFTESGYSGHTIQIYSTPRRVAVLVENLLDVQPLQEEELLGPPVRIAYDAQGAPTKAALGFAATLGIDVSALRHEKTDKGEYLAGTKKTGGQSTFSVLEMLCPAIITSLSFPKRMRWGSGTFQYARPLRWICALLDATPLAFTIGNVRSANQTFGHRQHGPGPFIVPHANQYLSIVENEGKLIATASGRRACIIQEGDKQAAALHGQILWNDTLLDEVQGLVEHPVPMIGDIDPIFLELPREVLLTSMQSHQKSFGVAKPDGSLLPHFLTVLNLSPLDISLVKNGWERVLRARLEDARFFWKTDLASSFDAWLTSLESVIFLAPLGSMSDKTHRIATLCAWLAKETGFADEALAKRAGRLSKADLVSAMVGEFDTLQGVMAGIYAHKMGEDPLVATALAEQYLPAGPDSPVPASPLGALLSIADKVDTLVGCFGLGMIPTGAADPYALRRCSLGIARIMYEKSYSFDIQALFLAARAAYGERTWKLKEVDATEKLTAFFALRVKNFFAAKEDVRLVEAVCTPMPLQPYLIAARLAALVSLSKQADFVSIVQTCKRMVNIVHKFDADAKNTKLTQWDSALLTEDAEKAFAASLTTMLPRFDAALKAVEPAQCFAMIEELRPVIEAFFDNTMVMCDDLKVRSNRVTLLRSLVSRLDTLVDLSALQI